MTEFVKKPATVKAVELTETTTSADFAALDTFMTFTVEHITQQWVYGSETLVKVSAQETNGGYKGVVLGNLGQLVVFKGYVYGESPIGLIDLGDLVPYSDIYVTPQP